MSKITPLHQNVKLLLTVTSDNHIDHKHPIPALPMYWLTQSVKDSAKSAHTVDAYISVGDVTSRGSEKNWTMAQRCFSKAVPAKQIFLTVGNHDLWADESYEAAEERYLRHSNRICKTEHTKTWFSHTVNGYKLIFLGNTKDAGCEAHLGEDQIRWLNEELDAAAGAPAFVFCHQSLNGRHGLPRTWDRDESATDPMEGGIGTESDEVAAILKAHKNVFYISGHSHMGLCGEKRKAAEGYASFEEEDGVTLVNLPSLACGNHHGDDRAMGVGMVIEGYEDKVAIRPRNFAHRSMNRKVAIKDGKPYWEQAIR